MRWEAKLKCKVDQIRDAWAAGDQIGALRIAAQFFDRSTGTKAFKRGMDATGVTPYYGNAKQNLAWQFCQSLS